MSSVFSKIVQREIPAYIVYEDELVMAFLDITQATKGHTLVIPKEAYENIFVMPEALASHLFGVATKIAKSIQKAFHAPALNILSNNGEMAGQSVFHFHVHLIPRYGKGDENVLILANHQQQLTQEDYKERAQKIKEALS
ncbi:MAG: HIT family protein [Acholeplasmataceae bacterium]|jgi:histidine triad (HIT) family protein|nr:HIT family protein [Acholeplasmataceae bacterium]